MPRLALTGFGTFSASGTDTNALGFRRDYSQANGVTRSWGIDTDSRLGLQLDLDFNESWHIGAQWIARNIIGDFAEKNLDWAYLRWRPSAQTDIRAGRLGLDVYFLSDYRNVGYAYPWIRPPQEFYGSTPVHHYDGADISHKFSVKNGYLTVKGFVGLTESEVLQPPDNGTLESITSLFGGSLAYERNDWRFKIGYAYSEQIKELLPIKYKDYLSSPLFNQIWPNASSLIDKFSVKGKSGHFILLGAFYDDGTWLAQIEGGYMSSTVPRYPSAVSGYFSGGRRFGKWTLYSLFAMTETFNKFTPISQPILPIPQIQQLRDVADVLLNKSGIDQKSLSLGVRWDVLQNIALKAEWSHVWLGQNGSQLWVHPTVEPTPEMTVNVWSIGVDFIF
jgi:hypothetical protein